MCIFHYKKYNNINIHVSDYRVEKFFDLLKKNINEEESYIVSNEFFEEFFKFGIPDYNAHNVVSESDIELRNYIFNNVFKLKNNLNFNNDLFDIGIHVRGTDKKNEIPEINIDKIINKIKLLTNNYNRKIKLFIATDEFKYIERIKNDFLDVDVFYFNDNIISYNGEPIHFTHNKDLIDYQVLRDVYTLKNCNTIFYCYSNVSLMSIMIGYTNFKEKILLN
jgi:hypothetical protein